MTRPQRYLGRMIAFVAVVALIAGALAGELQGAFLANPAPVAHAPAIPVFRGQGVQPGVDLTDSAALLAVLDAEP